MGKAKSPQTKRKSLYTPDGSFIDFDQHEHVALNVGELIDILSQFPRTLPLDEEGVSCVWVNIGGTHRRCPEKLLVGRDDGIWDRE